MFTRKTTTTFKLLIQLSLLLSIVMLRVEGLSVVNQQMRVRSVSVAQTKIVTGTASILVNEDLYSGSAGPIGFLGNTASPNTYFPVTQNFVASVLCSNSSEAIPNSTSFQLLSFPFSDSYYVVHGFDNLDLFSDVFFPDCSSQPQPNHRALTIIIPLQFTSSSLGIFTQTRDPVEFLQSCKPQITLKVVNQSGSRLPGIIFNQVIDPTRGGFSCDAAAMQSAVSDQFAGIQSFTPFGDDKGIVCADKVSRKISSSPIFQSYIQFLNSLFIKNITVVGKTMKTCGLSPSDPAYSDDPCCNGQNFAKCCYPRLFNIYQTKLVLNQSALQTLQSTFSGLSITRLSQLLDDYAFTINTNGLVDDSDDSVGDTNDDDNYNNIQDSFSNTFSAAYQANVDYYTSGSVCSSDSDCPPGVFCSSYGNCSSFMFYPWVVEGLFNRTFDITLNSLNLIPAAKATFQLLQNTTPATVKAILRNLTTQNNCWGRNNKAFINNINVTYNLGSPSVQPPPGPQGGCNSSLICYHNPNITIGCVSVVNGNDHYCGSCLDIRDPASCVEEFPELNNQTKCNAGKCLYSFDDAVSVFSLNGTLCNATGKCSATQCGSVACTNKTICESNGVCKLTIPLELSPFRTSTICVVDLSILPTLGSLGLLLPSIPTINNCSVNLSPLLFPGKCLLTDPSYVDATTCSSIKGTLYNTDLKSPTCNFGNVCVKNNAFTAGNQSECGLCGGIWQPRLKYVPNTWIIGKKLQLYWLQKKFGPVNFFANGVSDSLLKFYFNKIAASPLMRQITTATNTKYSIISKIMDVLSSACSANTTSQNFFGKSDSTYVTTLSPGVYAKAESSGHFVVQMCNDCDNDSVNISLYPASFIAKYNSKKRASSNDGSYSVVTQGDGQTTTGASNSGNSSTIIGQIVGNGIEIRSDSGNSNSNITLYARDDIAIEDPKFTELLFAQKYNYNNNDNEISVFECQTTVIGNSVTCSISLNGIYFPAYVRPDWKSYTQSSTSSSSLSTSLSSTSTSSLSTSTSSSSTSLLSSSSTSLLSSSSTSSSSASSLSSKIIIINNNYCYYLFMVGTMCGLYTLLLL